MAIQNDVRTLLEGREAELIQYLIGDPSRYQMHDSDKAHYIVDLMLEHDPLTLVKWAGMYLHDAAEVS